MDALYRVRHSSRLGLYSGCGLAIRALWRRNSRRELIQNLPRREFTEADGRHQIRRRRHAALTRDACVVGIVEAVQRDLVLAPLALQQLLADLNGAHPLVLIQPVLDLVAGSRT